MIQPLFRNGCSIKVGVFMSVVFWAAGEEVSRNGRGQLVLGACVGGGLDSLWVLHHLLGSVATANVPLCLAGIEPHGNMVKQPAIFTVDTISAGQGDLMVFVEDPEGNREEVCMFNVLRKKVKLVRTLTFLQ